MVFDYPSKKELKASIGQALKFRETSLFGPEYRSTGSLIGCNRPHITGHKREFFASVIMKDDKIAEVK